MINTQNSPAITDTEKRVLQNLHLRGVMGSMGSMKQRERLKLLEGLIAKGLIDSNCNVTRKGIDLSIYHQPKNDTVMKTIITNRHWMGYAYGNPWETKANRLYTTVGTLYTAEKAGLLRVETNEKSENGFVYGTWHTFFDAEGQIAQFYNDHYFMLQDSREVTIYRDFKPLQPIAQQSPTVAPSPARALSLILLLSIGVTLASCGQQEPKGYPVVNDLNTPKSELWLLTGTSVSATARSLADGRWGIDSAKATGGHTHFYYRKGDSTRHVITYAGHVVSDKRAVN